MLRSWLGGKVKGGRHLESRNFDDDTRLILPMVNAFSVILICHSLFSISISTENEINTISATKQIFINAIFDEAFVDRTKTFSRNIDVLHCAFVGLDYSTYVPFIDKVTRDDPLFEQFPFRFAKYFDCKSTIEIVN